MEAEFLEKNYPDLAEINGTPYLEKRLSEILVVHIKTCLPNLMNRVSEETLKCQDKLKALGKEVVNGKSEMLSVITTFARS